MDGKRVDTRVLTKTDTRVPSYTSGSTPEQIAETQARLAQRSRELGGCSIKGCEGVIVMTVSGRGFCAHHAADGIARRHRLADHGGEH